MDFLKTIIDCGIANISEKEIDPLKHDFDSENLSERLYSLYSVILNLNTNNIVKVRPILHKYDIEIKFLKEVNKSKTKDVQKPYLEMISKLRENKISQILE